MISSTAAVRAHFEAMDRASAQQAAIERQYLANLQSLMPRRASLVRPGKCDSCGSREFREHHGQTVCSYCRSTAGPACDTSGPAVRFDVPYGVVRLEERL